MAGQRVQLPLGLSPEDVACNVADELVAERLAIERRKQAAVAQLEARDKAEQAAAFAEAAETLANQHAAMALKRYADAYHAFFRAEYRPAVSLLDEANGLHGNDPRFFYLRGLARLRLGQSQPATDDFRAGGERERQRPYGVFQALERIQGHERMRIEQYRP
ncbi:MAG: dienelactone hydrolase family protein [Pirellulaceae bacterium]|nr:dienelactone hydrolase family protein [Pirellulaceae bacterium]